MNHREEPDLSGVKQQKIGGKNHSSRRTSYQTNFLVGITGMSIGKDRDRWHVYKAWDDWDSDHNVGGPPKTHFILIVGIVRVIWGGCGAARGSAPNQNSNRNLTACKLL
jgi:hypothetical protein